MRLLLLGLLTCSPWAQAPADSPVMTEAQRQQIQRTVGALTPQTFPGVLARAEAGDQEARLIVGIAYAEGRGVGKDASAGAT